MVIGPVHNNTVLSPYTTIQQQNNNTTTNTSSNVDNNNTNNNNAGNTTSSYQFDLIGCRNNLINNFMHEFAVLLENDDKQVRPYY